MKTLSMARPLLSIESFEEAFLTTASVKASLV
jgi:hypothetical protein